MGLDHEIWLPRPVSDLSPRGASCHTLRTLRQPWGDTQVDSNRCLLPTADPNLPAVGVHHLGGLE